MQRVHADNYILLGTEMTRVRIIVTIASEGDDESKKRKYKSEIRQHFKEIIELCDELDLPISKDIFKKLLNKLPKSSRELEIANDVILSELENKLFLFVRPNRAEYYEEDILWCEQFPKAGSERKLAGNAYTAGLDTACVYHCMRSLEIGLHALALDVGIDLPRPIDTENWANIIDQIGAEIRKKRGSVGATSADPKINFWSNAASQFFIFKEAWRNQTMHVRPTYTESEARKILESVTNFMGHLSTELTDQG